MLLTVVTATAIVLLILLIYIGSYAGNLREANATLVGEGNLLKARIKAMEKTHHVHLENIAKIYLAEADRLRGKVAELAAVVEPLKAAVLADEKLADLNVAMEAVRPSKPVRDAQGRFVKKVAS